MTSSSVAKNNDALGEVRKFDTLYLYGKRTEYVIEIGIVFSKGKTNVKVDTHAHGVFVFNRHTGLPQNDLEKNMYPTRIFFSLQDAVDTLDAERLCTAIRKYFRNNVATDIPVNMLRDVAAILNLDEVHSSIPVSARCK